MGQNQAMNFVAPIKFYDIHVYFNEHDPTEIAKAQKLHQALIKQFPNLRVFELVPRPVGPHPIGMFEVHLYTMEQFSSVIPWLTVNRDGLSALIHPNTHEPLKDHSEHPLWLGERQILNLTIFNRAS